MFSLVSGVLCIESCVLCLLSPFWIVFRGLWLGLCLEAWWLVACGIWLLCHVFGLEYCLLCLVCRDLCGTCVCFSFVVVVSYVLGVCYDLSIPKIPSWSVPAAGSGVVAICEHSA